MNWNPTTCPTCGQKCERKMIQEPHMMSEVAYRPAPDADEVRRLREENERLRAGLEEIMKAPSINNWIAARAALAGKDGGK